MWAKCGPRSKSRQAGAPLGKEKPRLCGAVSRALCRTRTGDPFLTMAVGLGVASSCGTPKCLRRAVSGTRQAPVADGMVGHPPLPTRYPGRANPSVRSPIVPRSRGGRSSAQRGQRVRGGSCKCALGKPWLPDGGIVRTEPDGSRAVPTSRYLTVSRAPAAGSARGRSRSARPGSRGGPSPRGRRSRRLSRGGRRGSAG